MMYGTEENTSRKGGGTCNYNKMASAICILTIYLELVFHLYMGLDMRYAPVFLLSAASAGMLFSAILSILPNRAAKWAGTLVILVLCAVYTV